VTQRVIKDLEGLIGICDNLRFEEPAKGTRIQWKSKQLNPPKAPP
jgi:hypothetical protein